MAKPFVSAVAYLSFAMTIMLAVVPTVEAGERGVVKIGMAKSFIAEQPKSLVEIASSEFKDVLKKTTGFDGELVSKFTSAEMAEQIQNKQLDFGVFYGHEFAWAQKKYPDLKPLLIAANKQHLARVYLVINKKTPIKSLEDLKGKKLDVPTGTSEPARLFLAKLCPEKNAKGVQSYFDVKKSASPADALDDLARKKVDAVIVDASALAFYKDVKGPVFENNLAVLRESEAFPPVVIAYKNDGVGEASAKQFRDGLMKAHTVPAGQDMMKSWNIDAFEAIPMGYSKSIAEVLKAYPPPSE